MASPNRLRFPGPVANGHGKLYEERAAKKLGARQQPNSGAMAGAKGDLRSDSYLIESKTTVAATLPIDLGWLVKISEEAHALGLQPLLMLSFVLPSGRPRPNAETEWVAMPLKAFQELTDGR